MINKVSSNKETIVDWDDPNINLRDDVLLKLCEENYRRKEHIKESI